MSLSDGIHIKLQSECHSQIIRLNESTSSMVALPVSEFMNQCTKGLSFLKNDPRRHLISLKGKGEHGLHRPVLEKKSLSDWEVTGIDGFHQA